MTTGTDLTMRDLLASGVRWREDIPTATRQDTEVLRACRVPAYGKFWYWVYRRKTGWVLQGSLPQPPAIDR